MALRCRQSQLLLWLTTVAVVMQTCMTQESPLVFISHTGTVRHRIHCTEQLICVGNSSRVFWTFLGGGATPVSNSLTRSHIAVTTNIMGVDQTRATLTFDPVVNRIPESYVCQILGDDPIALNVQVIVDNEPAAITSEVPNNMVNISTMTLGDPIAFACQVDTCLENFIVTFFKDGIPIMVPPSVNQTAATHEFNLQQNSAGTYTCAVNVTEFGFMSMPETFILTGIPMNPPTPSPMTTTPPVMATPQPSPSSPMLTPTPTAGAKTVSAELPLFFSLLLVLLVTALTTTSM